MQPLHINTRQINIDKYCVTQCAGQLLPKLNFPLVRKTNRKAKQDWTRKWGIIGNGVVGVGKQPQEVFWLHQIAENLISDMAQWNLTYIWQTLLPPKEIFFCLGKVSQKKCRKVWWFAKPPSNFSMILKSLNIFKLFNDIEKFEYFCPFFAFHAVPNLP